MAARLVTTSVVVLSHRPEHWLQRCLESVVPHADEVILVDNGSPASSASTVAEAAGARVIRSGINLGYAAGVNLGVRQSCGDVIGLLNDDAVAGEGWLEAASRRLERPGVAAVVPKVLRSGWYLEVVAPPDRFEAPADHRSLGTKLVSVEAGGTEVLDRLLGSGVHPVEVDPGTGGRWRWTVPGQPFYIPLDDPDKDAIVLNGEPHPGGTRCRLLNKAGGYLLADGTLGDVGDETPDDGRWDDPSEPFFGSGTALAFKRETFDAVGGLAEPFFAYYEDGDWCWRARLAGMTVVYDPTAVVEHLHSATSGGNTPPVRRLANRNRALTLVRNAPRGVALHGLRRALRDRPEGASRSDLAGKAAWAARSRRRLSRTWKLSPGEVWEAWAGAGTDWDRGPVRT